jgi:hypothetical protein
MSDNEAACVPLVIGVVGHRRIHADDQPPLRKALAAVIREYQAAYPMTPLVVLTSLAQGADTLAAHAALECGVHVRAALPMPRSAYRASSSFDDDDARNEFDKILDRPKVELLELAMPESAGQPPDDWAVVANSKEPACADYRHLAYAVAGLYLVRHSDVLVALWDGEQADETKPSGTAEHVALKLDGVPPQSLGEVPGEPLGVYSERGPVVVLHTPRSDQRRAAHAAGVRDVRTPLRTQHDKDGLLIAPAYQRTYGNSNGNVPLAKSVDDWPQRVWNWLGDECRRCRQLWSDAVESWRETPHPETTISDAEWGAREIAHHQARCQTVEQFNREIRALPESEKAGGSEWKTTAQFFSVGERLWVQRIAQTRKAAGTLSGVLEKRIRRLQTTIFVLLFVSMLGFHLFGHLTSWPKEADHPHYNADYLWVAVLSVLAALVLGMVASIRNFDRRRLDYRALAEALRVRIWWCVAGVGKSVALAYPEQVRGEVGWIRQAVRNLSAPSSEEFREAFDRADAGVQRQRLESVRQGWIADQVKQHFKGHHRQHRKSNLLRRGGMAVAGAGWIGMAVLLGVDFGHWMHASLVAIGMLTIAGGLTIGYSERRTHEELANQYQRAHQVFRNGLREVDARLAADDVAGARAVCETLGVEALNENGQWLTIRRSKPVEIHVA